MQKKATDKAILTAIATLTIDYAPTMREIADKVGLMSTSTIYDRLKKLEREGLVKNSDVTRGISLTDKGRCEVDV